MNLQVFNSPEFGKIEVVVIDGKKHIEAIPCAKALGYANPHDAVLRHCPHLVKHEVGVETGKKADGTPAIQMVEKTFIPEGDLYRLIVRSNLPEAEKFERWVFDEVLPTISATGGYGTPQLPTDRQSLSIDNVPIDVPAGVPFSVSRSKTGVITVRVKAPPQPKPTPEPPKSPEPVKALPKPKPVPKKPPKPKGVCLSIPKYKKAADKIMKRLANAGGDSLLTWVVFRDKRIVPWDITEREYKEILNLLEKCGTIVQYNRYNTHTFGLPR